MPDVLVLCYHAVSERFPAALSVTPEAFERQLALLAKAGYRGATFEQAVQARSGRTVAITFDDAYLSVLTLGKPLLDAVGFPATVYAPTAYLDTPERPLSWAGIEQWHGGEHERELLPMSWDQLGGLADAGWEIGSHTRSHPHLTQIGDDAAARASSRSRKATRRGAPRAAVPDARLPLRRPRRARRGRRRGGRVRGRGHPARAPALRAGARLAARRDLPHGRRAPLPDEGLAPAAAAAQLPDLAGSASIAARMTEATKGIETDQASREASGAHAYGRYLEEFEVGAVYKHWPAKTVTEADDHLFCLITMNHHPLHLNDVYARESQQGRNVVVGPLVYSLALGMSVSDVSGKAIANLATEELSHPAPVFHGDTLFAESEVLEVRPSESKPDRGVVRVHTRVYKEDGTLVAEFKRAVLVPKRP